MQLWKEMEGKTVAGRYALGALLRSTERSAWFATRDDRQRPWVVFMTESQNEEDRLLKNLEAAGRVKHANVVCIEKSGRTRIDDKAMVYAVLEPTEENLEEILKERALTADETAEITASLVAGLTAIHEQGMWHGQVNPANVLACGETVKLSSECLKKLSPEGRDDAIAQDTGDLGATVFRALTQRTLTSPDDPSIKKLPVPFRSIVQSSVIGRWGLADIAAALRKPSLEDIRHPIPNVETATKPRFAEDATPKTIPAVGKGPGRAATPSSLNVSAPAQSRKTALRVVAIIALVAAMGVLWFFYRSRTVASDMAETAATQPERAAPATPAIAPARHSAAPVTSGTEAAVGDHKIWRVVVYTFANKSAAEHKVAALTLAHPEMKPEVFSARGQSPWLVTVGGPMDHAQAVELRGQVRNQGMPGDSYAQNYSH